MSALKRILFVLFVAYFPVFAAFRLVFPDVYPVFSPIIPVRPVLVLDAGHGGEDGGAISPSGVAESHLNLAVAKRVERILGLYGVPVVMLREGDLSLHEPQANTLREKKNSDLRNRVERIARQPNAVLLSIHQNSFSDSKYSGAQVFYAPTAGSQVLAEAMQATLRTVADPSNTRKASAISNDVYLLNHIACPAVLVECGFLTNPAEERRLQDPHYQIKLAAAMSGCWLDHSGTSPFQDRDEGIK